MPTEYQVTYGHLPTATVDKNPTPFDRIMRDKRVIFGALAVLLLTPPLLIFLAWFVFSGPIKAFLGSQFWFSILMMAISLFIIIHLCAACILAERKVSAYIQDRFGPNRVGWGGLLQPIADGIKFILKEDVIPANVDKPLFVLAPALAFVIALVTFPIIPWAGVIVWPWDGPDGQPAVVTTQVASLDIGVLYLLALASMSVYGVVLGGWASNNKYAHYGSMRAAAQMLSYEIPIGLAVLTLLLLAGSLRPEIIQGYQTETGLWFILLHPIMFLLLLTASYAETNRTPFDLAECEQELIAGYHTEYSAMKFALFFLAEYSHMIVGSALVVCLFLGGWEPLPFVTLFPADAAWANTWWAALIKFHIFWGKIVVLIVLFMLVRWTIPRFRFDQLMRLAWKGMIPIGMLIVVAEGLMVGLGLRLDPTRGAFGGPNLVVLLAHLLLNGAIIAGVLLYLARVRPPVTGRQANLPAVEIIPAEAAAGQAVGE
jgi:NADH-quinone oxidoreductase subunit H